MAELKAQGVAILGPPIWTMLTLNDKREIVPSEYAKAAKAAGLDLIGWSLERDGPLHKGGGFYHKSIKSVDRSRRRYADGAGRARQTGRRARHVLGLAGDDDVLCELHGDEVRGFVASKGGQRSVSDVPTIYHRARFSMVGTLRFAHPTALREAARQFSFIGASPTTRRSIRLIRSERSVSAALMASVVCRNVLTFDPSETMPPSTAAIEPSAAV